MKIGLAINTQKMEFMINTSCKKNLTLNNADIKLVDDFTYLGSKMASSESDIKRQLGLAWSTFWKLERLWRSKSVPTNLKVNLFKATCLSILLHGCEGWTLTKKLNSTAMPPAATESCLGLRGWTSFLMKKSSGKSNRRNLSS